MAGAYASGVLASPCPAIYLDLGTNGELLLTTGTDYLDLGTNGELLLTTGTDNGGHLYAASCAVGPCFEGAGIGSGVGGIPGAISRVSMQNGEWIFSTVGDEKPIGITGSGLIDLIACLLGNGTVARDGRLDQPFHLTGRQVFSDGTLSESVATPVTIDQSDVRAVQTAKSAVRAGIAALLSEAWIDPDEIGCVLLAGSFGLYLSPSSAAAIGLMPKAWAADARAVGNAALDGAEAALLSAKAREGIVSIANASHVVDLNSSGAFRDAFLSGLNFQ